ncbi:MAG: hypothetical protein F6K25_24740 [Okeania sp. SIO2G4]|uniref:hypothetical protein n=1 Tax=unclassified Okeania TaxID=2634635 RepID=UPI0013BDA7BA|nr:MULTISPECIES: hypothetical protein [unclassified Okeania]NEP06354.1 hypothetical protein [Okeania sp. SIO4D6]NEP39373.1 hypothetical protein [Okeania sp. SIO2H7]NEP73938.1 hypothetical protein [Okeania sp. SIO2G5]NEP94752.1 hypothetical protein [Okeania sp. SIO2F5]NEQ93691.1 hypothetical protein [Okeania sp. SIO2G4]
MNKDDPVLKVRVERLYRLIIYVRWLIVGLLWMSIGFLSLWSLRREISLWAEHFTWIAVRYALIYHRLPTLGLGLCIGMTTAVLVWQSRHILWGLSPEEQKRLEEQVCQIRAQGPTNILWKWVIKDNSN